MEQIIVYGICGINIGICIAIMILTKDEGIRKMSANALAGWISAAIAYNL